MRKKRRNKRSQPKNKPTLHFGTGDLSGWTPVGISGYRGSGATPATRELIQNGLDAASDAKVTPARMLFRVRTYKTRDIPGIEAYRQAFQEAQESWEKKTQGDMPDNAITVIEEIRSCLDKETCEVLHVLDNGIGLDEIRMEALLTDGRSAKDSGAAGSYGNGHIVAFPASNLRYVMYGGLILKENQQVRMLCSGHIILASREGKKKEGLSKDGYFVNKLTHDFFNPHDFPEGNEIPSLVRDQLDYIESEWGTGSVVSIIGFNHFRNQDKEQTIRAGIFRAASSNFFEAINRDQLVIGVEENGETEFLNRETLGQVLCENKHHKRSSDGFLTGNRAFEAFRALNEGDETLVSTCLGDVKIIVKQPLSNGPTRVDLCRNGMWITDNLPRYQNHFGRFAPFHCVIPILANIELNRFIRKAEGPLHNKLSMSLLTNADDKDKLSNALVAIREKLKEIVPTLDDESFRPPGIFQVRTGGLERGGRKPNTTGTLTVVKPPLRSTRLEPDDETEDEIEKKKGRKKLKRKRKRSKSFQRSGNHIQFQGLVVPTGHRSCKVSIVSGAKNQNSELRFIIDESIDITSHGGPRESFAFINPDDLLINGRPVQDEFLRQDDAENVLGIELGSLDENEICQIEFKYSMPDDLLISDDQEVVLKAEMIRRASAVKEEGV